MWRRIFAVFVARNREFYRDHAGLGWNIFMPILMVLAFAFIFSGDPQAQFKVGVITADGTLPQPPTGLLALDHVQFVPFTDPESAALKVERHQIDLLVDVRGVPITYWVNLESPRGYLAERLLLGAEGGNVETPDQGTGPVRRTVSGAAVSYADWVLPGVLAMNVMFSSLWGVGWVIVRYRKNGVLRRLKATPLSPFEFLTAQVLSRLLVVMSASLVVYTGATLLLDFPMRGSYVALALIYAGGALCLISLGLIVSARLRTEELADGILNLISWPMLLLSGVWFSMEGTSAAARFLSQLAPLTHVVDAARRVMIDGAMVVDVLPQIVLLVGLALAFLALAAWLFRWE
ncbi:ABC transporter permease [uncultured Lamprocystis sp.]|jgi:ABC-type multidrug transport system permease subunit|uniref:ABC transporter permease n=1 Tax=uncultured Lamprocystis sp. TaxID=543132 RepID=UPI0025F4F38E|nr:ABC transporter permease [uncultured Lamprocystis sp.]